MTATAFDRITAALEAHGSKTRTTGTQQLQAQCPAHEDRNPSLTVTGIEGQTLVHCHGGCHVDDVLASLDLAMADLFDDSRGASYSYQDTTGTTLRMVSRTPDKRFRQSGDTKGPSTLYRLPQVLAAIAEGRPVYLVEGEKDVHALETVGVTATTAPMGASNFTKVDASPLLGADVIAVVDRDQGGQRWAADVHDTLHDRAKTITWCQAAEGKDAADHIAAGHTLDQLRAFTSDEQLIERLDAAAELAREVDREVHRLRVREAARSKFDEERAPDLPPMDVELLEGILARPQEPPHRIAGLVPSEGGTLIPAMRKTGKTTFVGNLGRSLLTGAPFLGRFETRKLDGNVGFLNYEVSGAQLGRWAHEMGLDPKRFLLANLRGRRNPLSREDDRAALAAILRAHDIEALIVDPFGRAFTGSNQNDASEVGAWLADLDRFARGDSGVTDVFLTAHTGWGGERTRGSTALEDWADSIITLTRGDGDDEKTRFMRAEGRDIDVDEDELAFDPDTRLLTLTGGGSRRAASQSRQVSELVGQVEAYVVSNPGCSKNKIETELKGRRDSIRQAVAQAVASGAIWQDLTGGRIAHYPSLAQPRPTSPEATPTDLAPSPIRGEGEGERTTPTPGGEGEPCDTCRQPLLLNNGRTTCERCRLNDKEAS